MKVGDKDVKEIIVHAADKEVLAVISDTEIIEKKGVAVVLVELS